MIQIPQNITVEVVSNTVVIKFTKGQDALQTEIDRFWVNGQGTYDDYTGLGSFYYDGLEWGQTYQFKLRSISSTGEVAETETLSFSIEQAITPTIASNVQISVDKQIAQITFTPGTGVRTYIDKYWVNGEGTLDEYTTGGGFYLEGLPWGLEGQFKLITRSNAGVDIATEVYSFKIEDEIIPTLPTNVLISIVKNNAQVTFTKGAGVKTLIDKYWVDGQGTFDEFTANDGAFYFDALAWGTTYQFKLRTLGNTGLTVDSEVYSFTIEDEIIPTAPTNVTVTVFKNNAEIHFTKGAGVRTLLDKYWVDGQGTFDEYTVNDNVFYLSDLAWGTHYEFALRSLGNSGLTDDTQKFSFDIEKAIGPKLPTSVSVTVDGNTAAIVMAGQEGIRFEIAKSWDGGLATFDEYTTGNGYYYDGLAWGTHHEFIIRAVSNTGATLSSEIYSFDVVASPTPIAPTDITQELGDGSVTVRFTKGNGVRTQIDCSWINGLDTWDSYTTGSAFYFESLPSNSMLQYKLRTVSASGEYAESALQTFYTPIA